MENDWEQVQATNILKQPLARVLLMTLVRTMLNHKCTALSRKWKQILVSPRIVFRRPLSWDVATDVENVLNIPSPAC